MSYQAAQKAQKAQEAPRWEDIKPRLAMAEVVERFLGPPPGRKGERSSRRSWWVCPMHADSNPSFVVTAGDTHGHCHGCSWHGDAIEFVQALHPGTGFREAVAILAGEHPAMAARPASRPSPSKAPKPDRATMLDPADALTLVELAEQALWSEVGEPALAYLRGRGLTDETIRAAKLGWTPGLALPGRPEGIVIPWFEDEQLELVKLRQPDGRRPKYREVYRSTPTLYPDPDAIEPGRPVVIVEGEFDALLLGQQLWDATAVVTLGGASVRPTTEILGRLLAASPWLIATDNDPAGEKRAREWTFLGRRCKRVRPPAKDWTDAHAGGHNRIRATFMDALDLSVPWEELETWRWGPALNDPDAEEAAYIFDLMETA